MPTPTPRALAFPRTARLHGPEAFRRVFDGAVKAQGRGEKGGRVSSGPFHGVFLAGGGMGMRLGLSVPRKVGGAVVRNRVRRQLREAFRTLKGLHTAGFDLVIVVRPHGKMDSASVRSHVENLLGRVAEASGG